MSTLITLTCLFGAIIPYALGNILAYPVCKKASLAISRCINYILAPRIFAILHTYKKFNFWGYNETKKELPEQFIVISNHQSLLDIPTFMKFLKEYEIRFVAKDTLGRHVPLVSEMLRVQQHCLVPRKARPMEAMKYIEEFGKRCVDTKKIPIIFPEGTRTKDGEVGKFYSAGFRKLTESTNLPVVVCALDGGYQLRDLKKLFVNMKKGCYRVKVLKVYDCPKTKEECNTILEEGRELIQKQVKEWRQLPSTEK